MSIRVLAFNEPANGTETDLNTTFTCTWVEQDGTWKLVAWQATKKPDS